LSEEKSFLVRAAKAHNIPVEDLERECLGYLHTGSERGFQFLRLVLDYAMDMTRESIPNVKVSAIQGTPADHLPALQELAREFSEISEDDPQITDWARQYQAGHAWRISHDVTIAISTLEGMGETGSEASILEVGAAPYLFTAYMNRLGYQIHGVDLDPSRQARLVEKEQITVFQHDLESSDPGSQLAAQYDLVVFNEVFEHLRINPLATLRKIRSWLKPEGRLILSTPNAQSLDGFRKYISPGSMFGLSAMPYFEYQKLEKIGHMGHVREYTAPEVMHTLGKMGFTIETLNYRFSPNLIKTIVIPVAHARWGSDFILTCRKSEDVSDI